MLSVHVGSQVYRLHAKWRQLSSKPRIQACLDTCVSSAEYNVVQEAHRLLQRPASRLRIGTRAADTEHGAVNQPSRALQPLVAYQNVIVKHLGDAALTRRTMKDWQDFVYASKEQRHLAALVAAKTEELQAYLQQCREVCDHMIRIERCACSAER